MNSFQYIVLQKVFESYRNVKSEILKNKSGNKS